MSVTVTIEFKTVDEAIVALGKFAGDTTTVVSTGVASQAAKEAVKQVNAKEPTKAVQALLEQHGLSASDVTGTGKDGRVTKADVEAHVKAHTPPAEGGEEKPPVPADGLTIEDCRTALKDLNSAKGMSTCMEVLSRFGVSRVSDLPTDQYQAFIEKCGKVVEGEDV